MMVKSRINKGGFTIVELLIVIVVIAILVAISIVVYQGVSKKAVESLMMSSLQQAYTVLGADNTLSGAYPASLALAREGKGLNAGDDLLYDYTYESATNSCCLTINSTKISGASAYHITSSKSAPTAGACSGHSSGGAINLVRNGLGEAGSNTNFSSFEFNPNDAPPGAKGSFVMPNPVYNFYFSSETIPIDPDKRYILRGWARQTAAGMNSGVYIGLAPVGADGSVFMASQYMYNPGTTTTLARPLNVGDTVVYLSSISDNWYDQNDSLGYRRSFIFWNYEDPTGKIWGPETYSLNPWMSNMYNGGSGAINKTNNTITLNKPWTGKSYAVGHPLSNGSSGATYMYSAAVNEVVSGEWREFVSRVITGTTPGGLNDSIRTFPVGTKGVRIMIIANSGSSPENSRQAFGGIRFYEVP